MLRKRLRAASGVWAVGDVTGMGAYTHVAYYQAAIAVADILHRRHPPADYRAVPRVTFTDPEVGSVGLTEAEASRRGLAIRVGRAELPSSARGWIHKGGNDGIIKLVEDADAGMLVGATSVGPAGGEVLGLLALAIQARLPHRDPEGNDLRLSHLPPGDRGRPARCPPGTLSRAEGPGHEEPRQG